MPPIGLIIRIGIVLLIGGLLWYIGNAIHENGKEIQRLACIEAAEKLKVEHQKKVDKVTKELTNEIEYRERQAAKAIGVYANEIERINDDFRSADNERLRLSAKGVCPRSDNQTAGEAKDSSLNGGEVEFELSETLSRAFSEDYYGGSKLELKFNYLVDRVKESSCFEIIED